MAINNSKNILNKNYKKTVCVLCLKGDHPDVLLLCDGCDRGLHTYCIGLDCVPQGDFYCPACLPSADTKSKKRSFQQMSDDDMMSTDDSSSESDYDDDINMSCSSTSKVIKTGTKPGPTGPQGPSSTNVNKGSTMKSLTPMFNLNMCINPSLVNQNNNQPRKQIKLASPRLASPRNKLVSPRSSYLESIRKNHLEKSSTLIIPEVPVGKATEKRTPGISSEVVIYLRVSSKNQDDRHNGSAGLDTQNHVINEFVRSINARVKGTYNDVGTGRKFNRKQFYKMLMDLVPGQVVLIYNVSRFGRNLQESINYLEKIHLLGCYVYSVADQTASSEINFITLAQKAQEESDALSRIMRESIARRRATGVHVGPAPFGKRIYRDEDGNRRLADNLEEIAIIQTLKEVFNATGSIRSTIIELNQRQMLFRGKHWDKPKVIKVLNIF